MGWDEMALQAEQIMERKNRRDLRRPGGNVSLGIRPVVAGGFDGFRSPINRPDLSG